MSERRQVLKDAILDKALDMDGYVVVPFLSPEEVEGLVKTYYENHPKAVDHFYASAHVEDLEFRERMNQAIRKAYSRAIDEKFKDCKPLGGSFIVKPKGQMGVLDPHQDWNIVNEEQFRSYNIWVPLIDLTEENGVINVLPGSHKWVPKTYRHSSIHNVFGQVYPQVLENMKPLYMKAGEALIYDHAMVHASEINQTDELRLACAYGIIPQEADMIYFWNNNGQVEKYASNPQFFMTQNIFAGPKGLTKLEDVDYDFHQITVDEFYQLSGIEPPLVEEPVAAEPSRDGRTFWETYTPLNILKEIKFRLTGN